MAWGAGITSKCFIYALFRMLAKPHEMAEGWLTTQSTHV
jgi:hypothetical protein